MRDFRQLKVWERAHKLVLATYRVSDGFPKNELYGLTGQMRRASASIPANIAEGCGRSSNGDLHRFLSNAMGSAMELDYFVLLATDLGFLSEAAQTQMQASISELQRMLGALMRKVEAARQSAG